MTRLILRRLVAPFLMAGLILASGAVLANPEDTSAVGDDISNSPPFDAPQQLAASPSAGSTATSAARQSTMTTDGDFVANGDPVSKPSVEHTLRNGEPEPGSLTATTTTATTAATFVPASQLFPSSSGSDWYGPGFKGVDIRPRTPATIDWALGPIAAPRTGVVDSLALYFVFATEGSYFKGTGGINRFTIRPDSNGQPGQAVLGEFTISNPMQNIWSPGSRINADHFTFDSPVALTAGARYWIVAENLHADPANNWVGINAIVQGDGVPGTAYVHMETSPGSGVFERFTYPGEPGWFIGLFDLTYQEGDGFGQGYWFALFDQNVGGNQRAREVLTPSTNHTVTDLRVWVKGASGSGALTATLSSNGNIIAQSSASGSGWLTFPMSATLQSGTTYYLEFSAPSGSSYTFSTLRENAGWSAGSRFTDGYAEYHNGSDWTGGWPIWGSTSSEGDLMFAFRS